MKELASYLKSRLKAMLLTAAFCAIFAIVFALYKLPLGAVYYPALLCGVLGAGFLAFDFRRYLKKHRLLVSLEREIAVTLDGLPEPLDLHEQDYQSLLVLCAKDKKMLADKMAADYADLADYYTMWAHQIKTPIAAMRLILQNEDGGIPEHTAAELSDELFRIERYVELVMTYIRLDGGASDYLIREYDLDSIIRQVLRKFAPQFIRKKSVRLKYEPCSCRVLTDEKWLSIVLEQVISNAIKYTAQGEISILIDEHKTLRISDTGIGISSEDLARVFEKSYTGAIGRADKRATGLGLYLCKRICSKLNHPISIESTPGVGTTVLIGLDRGDFKPE